MYTVPVQYPLNKLANTITLGKHNENVDNNKIIHTRVINDVMTTDR